MIRVNQKQFDDNAIVAEMQYHLADSHQEAKNKACESLIVTELLKQRALELGLEVEDDDAQDAFIDSLIDIEVEIPQATEEECRLYFEKNPGKFTTSPLVSGRHILLSAPPQDAKLRSEALEQANLLIKQLEGDIALFPKLAATHSRCPSSKTGGHLGQISKGQTVPEFERQLFSCDEGLVKQPIESRYGVHVVEIDHKEPGKALPYEVVKQRVSEYLNEKVKRKAIAQYISQLIAQADIEGYDMNVSSSPLLQ